MQHPINILIKMFMRMKDEIVRSSMISMFHQKAPSKPGKSGHQKQANGHCKKFPALRKYITNTGF